MTDSNLAFVGTYADTDEEGVFGFRVDRDGTLHRTCSINAGPNPSFLTPDPSGEHLYVGTRPHEVAGELIAYEINKESGSLVRLNATQIRGNGTPCYCSVDATDQCVMTAQYKSGNVSIIPVNEDGCIGDPTVVEHDGSGPNKERQSDPHPHAILPGPGNEYAYAPDLGADRIFVYDLDPESVSLEPADCGHVDVHAGAGPRHLEFHPNNRYAYLINELDSTVVAFERDHTSGALDPFATVSTLPEDFNGDNDPGDIHVHPSGEYLYGSNRGHDSIVIYDLEADGEPVLIETEPVRGEWPRNFAIDPSGTFLFAENADTDTIVTFEIGNDGTLDATGQIIEVPSPVCMQFVNE